MLATAIRRPSGDQLTPPGAMIPFVVRFRRLLPSAFMTKTSSPSTNAIF